MVFSLKKLLLVSMLPCVVGLAIIGTLSAKRSLDDYNKLASTKVLGSLINVTATFAGIDLPTEGVTSTRYEATGDPDVLRTLQDARRKFDQSLALFREASSHAGLSDADAIADVDFILRRVGDLENFRGSVDARRLTSADIVGTLQPTAPRAFDLIKRIGLQADNPKISKMVDGFYSLLQFIDGVHIEDSIAPQALAQGKLAAAESEGFFVGLRTQDLFGPSILATSPKPIADALSAFSNGPAGQRLQALRGIVRADIVGGGAPVTTELSVWNDLSRQRLETLIPLIGQYQGELSNTLDRLVNEAWFSFLLYCGMTCGVLLCASALSFSMTRRVTTLIAGLSGAMTELADGNLDVAVQGADRHDELGLMARAVQVFKDGGREKVRLQAEAARHAEERNRERARDDAVREELSHHQAHVVASLAQGLGQLAGGQLAFRLLEPFPADYETLRVDFNGAMEKMQVTMTMVATNTAAIRSGTDEISSASDDLSRRTEQQAASLEETAAALDEITATVRKTAEGSKHAREVVSQAKQAAEQSGQVVRQAVDAMSGIEKSSSQIGNIIGVIDEIAFQTNLLALNAGVEAARAGDAGRGFAVVASEVRALAQRSAEAAKEIKALISASSTQVERGVDLVGQTGQALVTIVAQVAEINSIVSEIAASAQEQATGLDQVNKAVNQMDQVTLQNTAMVEETTAASHALSKETGELARLISMFQIGERPGGTTVHHAPKRGMSPSKPMTRTKPVAAMRTTGAGGAARKVENASDWQEF